MADTKTSDETAATTPTGAELVRIVQSATSKKTTAAVLGHQYRGARVRMSADDTTQNITSDTAITFDLADLDTDTFWSAGSPTRLTIPAGLGITHVELVGQANISSSTADTWHTVSIVQRNSSDTVLRTLGNRFMESGNTGFALQASTGVVPVSDGDYFTLTAREETDNSVTIEGDQAVETFLSLKVVGMEPV